MADFEKKYGVTREEIDSLSGHAKELAEAMIAIIDDPNGKQNGVRKTTVSLPAPAPEFSPTEIRGIREQLAMTQKTFARFLNVSVTTIENWEAGAKKPGPPARRLLQLVADKESSRVMARITGYGAPP